MPKSMFVLALVFIATCAFADRAVKADERPPEPPKPAAPKNVEADFRWAFHHKEGTRILIPKKFVQGVEGKKASFLHTRTVVSGVAMALAFAFGGLWLTRRKPGAPNQLGMVVCAAALVGALGASVYADVAPNFYDPTDGEPAGKVTIEFVDNEDAVRFVTKKETVEAMVKKADEYVKFKEEFRKRREQAK